MTDDLWGELPTGAGTKTPHSILLEQAQALTKRTDGVLVGRVVRVKRVGNPNELVSRFHIFAPALDYSYQVLNVHYGFGLYPVTLSPPAPDPDVRAENEKQFKTQLQKVLTSDRVRNAISGLLAQIHADTDQEEPESDR